MQRYCSISEWKYLAQNDLALSWAWSRVSSHVPLEDFGFNFLHRYDLLDPFSLCYKALNLLRDCSTSNHSVQPNGWFLEFFHLIQDLQIPPRPQQVTQKSWYPLFTDSTQEQEYSREELCSVGSLFPPPRRRPSPDSYTQNTLSCSFFCPNIQCLTLIVMFYSKCLLSAWRVSPSRLLVKQEGLGEADQDRILFLKLWWRRSSWAKSCLGVSNKKNTNLHSA